MIERVYLDGFHVKPLPNERNESIVNEERSFPKKLSFFQRLEGYLTYPPRQHSLPMKLLHENDSFFHPVSHFL